MKCVAVVSLMLFSYIVFYKHNILLKYFNASILMFICRKLFPFFFIFLCVNLNEFLTWNVIQQRASFSLDMI